MQIGTYEHQPDRRVVSRTVGIAVVASLLLALDIADQLQGPEVGSEIGDRTYAAVQAAGATIRLSDRSELAGRRVPAHLALLDQSSSQ